MILPRQVRSGVTPNSCCAPPGAGAKARDHLVEDQQRAVRVAERHAAPRRKPSAGGDHAHVAGDRLDDHARRSAACAREQRARPTPRSLYRASSVSAATAAGDARAGRHAERHRARARLHQERVGVTVIAALELDDLVALGRRARDADRAHRRFGARADEAHPFHRRHQHRDALRELASRARSARRSSCRCAAASASAFTARFGACPWISGPQDIT